jgi:outer membrane protein assembly factor BamD
MEKPDRDFAQAMRAADEYKTLIQTYPDSPLVPEAKQRLREVQEVLAERQYRIANFYFLRQNLAASQARLQSLVDSYPLYSKIDEALFTLGQLYEREAIAMRKQNIPEAQKERLAADFQKHAIESYSRIVSRYPAMDRADDARRRLQALNAPVPVPTAEAMAESKAEEQSRQNVSMMQGVMNNFKKRPMVAKASRVGDPDLKEEEIVDPAKMVHDLENQLNASGQPNEKVGLEAVTGVGKGSPRANEPPPGTTEATKPSDEGAPPPAAPAQVNEVKQQAQQEANSGQAPTATAPADQTAKKVDKKKESTSKKKKKKGLGRLNPF